MQWGTVTRRASQRFGKYAHAGLGNSYFIRRGEAIHNEMPRKQDNEAPQKP